MLYPIWIHTKGANGYLEQDTLLAAKFQWEDQFAIVFVLDRTNSMNLEEALGQGHLLRIGSVDEKWDYSSLRAYPLENSNGHVIYRVNRL